MSSRPSVLIVSNGHGEDAVGMALARELQGAAGLVAYPLVGVGAAYSGIPVLEPRRTFPSGGFALRGSAGALWADLRSGGFSHWQRQHRTLRQQRGRHHLIIAIGDVFCLWMASAAGSPAVFVATAKSVYNEPYRWPERLVIRRSARVMFTRDQATADALRTRGLPARYAGNPLMDTIPPAGEPLPLPSGAPAVVMLPGSRTDAPANLVQLLKLCARVASGADAAFICAVPPTVDIASIARATKGAGWEVEGQRLRSGHTTVLLTRAFGSALRAATVVVGLAGTANEQAAGLGIPVVAFPPQGAVQFTPRFLALQQKLLGEALVSAHGWEVAAEAVLRLLRDPAERARRGDAGRARMGSPGGVGAVAEDVLARLASRPAP